MRNKKGISLIVLIITIIVVIILAAAVIITMNNNNPMSSAKEATFKSDVRSFQDEFSMYIANKMLNNDDLKVTTEDYPSLDKMKEYISSFNKKYVNKLGIENGELVYYKSDIKTVNNQVTDEEEIWLKALGIKKKSLSQTDESEFTWGSDEPNDSEYGTIKKYNGSSSDVVIPERCTSISEYAFWCNNNIQTITITDNVKTLPITPRPFLDNCNNFSKVYVTENNKYYSSLDGILFNKDKTSLIKCPLKNNITKYTVADTVTKIGDKSFSDCDSLLSISIPNSVTWLGGNAFFNCDGITNIAIPESVIRISDERLWNVQL